MTFSNGKADRRPEEKKKMRLAASLQFRLSMLCNNQCEGQEVGKYWQMGKQKEEE